MKNDNKRQIRQEKRELKQIGNQNKRSREKRALRDLVDGKTEIIPEFRIDKPTKDLNGYDKDNGDY